MPTNQVQDPKMRKEAGHTVTVSFYGLQRGVMVKEHVLCRSRALLIETA
jgi:hypothetical protein